MPKKRSPPHPKSDRPSKIFIIKMIAPPTPSKSDRTSHPQKRSPTHTKKNDRLPHPKKRSHLHTPKSDRPQHPQKSDRPHTPQKAIAQKAIALTHTQKTIAPSQNPHHQAITLPHPQQRSPPKSQKAIASHIPKKRTACSSASLSPLTSQKRYLRCVSLKHLA